MTIVRINGKQYNLIEPSIPDPDHWVRLIPIKGKVKSKEECNHSFSSVYKGDYITGQRCSKCGKQEWF